MNAIFDDYAEDYDAALAKGISISGEEKDYFARARIVWLSDCLRRRGIKVTSVLDFGCGTGSSTPHFLEVLGVERVLGVDISPRSIAIATKKHGSIRADFTVMDQYQPGGEFDLAFCNGVFHHIAPEQREAALQFVYQSLGRRALFAFWENNPSNPGTRLIMSRCAFDAGAVTISPPEARRILKPLFAVISVDFLFVFPRILRALRFAEPFLSRLPLGAQYQVLCQRAT